MSHLLSGAFGNRLAAFWYHFAIMFEALFILTTVDAGTRVGRFMLQDMLGNVWKPIGRVSWWPGVWLSSALVVGAWGYFLWAGATDPLGGINQLFPLFGLANQLLAAIALTVATTLLIKSGRARWAWVTGIPLAWDVAVTFTASWQKVFSDDPRLGFFAQRDRYAAALDDGRILAPAKTVDDMHRIVQNSTVDGILVMTFALLVLVVLVDATRVCMRVARARVPVPTTEAEHVASRIVVPAGRFAGETANQPRAHADDISV
jgi:carbon starvation protein